MPPTIGAPAPEFTLKDQDQKEVKLSDFRGKKRVVLVFYPLDWSPTCTKEHACIVNDKKQFEQLDAQVLGLSHVGSLRAGADANLVVLDRDLQVTRVMAGGEWHTDR